MTSQPPMSQAANESLPATTKEYEVKNMSNWSAFMFVLAAPFSMLFAMLIGSRLHSAVAFIVAVAAMAGIMIYLFRYLQQKILVTVGQGAISIRYLHSPFFVPTSNMDIVPGDVASYKFENFNGATFTLYLKDGRRFRAAVGNIGKTEAIVQMADHITTLFTDKQYSPASKGAQPHRRKTYAEGTTGLVLAMVAIAGMIAMGVGIVFFPYNHKTSDTVRGIGVMFTCLAFVLYVFNLRRKAREEKDKEQE
jgi:hypothetical protein